MLVKTADSKQPNIDALTALARRHDVGAATQKRIQQEIKSIRGGVAGEEEAAYEIDFYLAQRRNWAVIHDLRLEVEGRVAQIDHVLINRMLEVFLLETKHFSGGVGYNERGEWVRYWDGQPRGIDSPVEQNQKHKVVMEQAFGRSVISVPKRLGVQLKPSVKTLVLLSSKARISRPSGKQPPGHDSVIKVDQLVRTLDGQFDKMGVRETLGRVPNLITPTTLGEFALAMAEAHKPIRTDWAARFGIGSADRSGLESAGGICAVCGASVSGIVAAFCHDNAARFGGRILCYKCQRQPHEPGSIEVTG